MIGMDASIGDRGGDRGGRRRRTPAEVRASLDRSMRDLRESLARLERLARSEVDLGRYVADHAAIVLAIGFAGGALLGALTVRSYVVVAPGRSGRRTRALPRPARKPTHKKKWKWT